MTMKLTITMELDNSIFLEDGANEVARILASVGERIPDPLRPTDRLSLHDANGNHVGQAEIVESSDGNDERIKALRGVLHHNKGTKEQYRLPASLIRQVENALLA